MEFTGQPNELNGRVPRLVRDPIFKKVNKYNKKQLRIADVNLTPHTQRNTGLGSCPVGKTLIVQAEIPSSIRNPCQS